MQHIMEPATGVTQAPHVAYYYRYLMNNPESLTLSLLISAGIMVHFKIKNNIGRQVAAAKLIYGFHTTLIKTLNLNL